MKTWRSPSARHPCARGLRQPLTGRPMPSHRKTHAQKGGRDMFPPTSGLKETLGAAIGTAMAPLFAIGSALRNARFFHPHGVCFHATVKPAKTVQRHYLPLAKRLSGDALVR